MHHDDLARRQTIPAAAAGAVAGPLYNKYTHIILYVIYFLNMIYIYIYIVIHDLYIYIYIIHLGAVAASAGLAEILKHQCPSTFNI
jgi:hypothetical protein